MKRMLPMFFAILIVFFACKKKEVFEPVSGGGWWSLGLDTTYHFQLTVKKTTFNITKVARQTINGEFVLAGTDATLSDSLQLFFATQPLYNKKYASISFGFYPYSYPPHLNANQIGIRSRINIPNNYYNYSEFFGSPKANNYFGLLADSIDVSVNNGKITVSIPRILTDGFIANQDSAALQGVLIEK